MKTKEIVLWCWILILTIMLGVSFDSNEKLQMKINNLDKRITLIEKKIDKVSNKLDNTRREQESFINLTSEEIEGTWRSIARMRNNFMALGTGYHLSDNDVMGSNDDGSYDVEEEDDQD